MGLIGQIGEGEEWGDGADWVDREALGSRQTSWLSIILKAGF